MFVYKRMNDVFCYIIFVEIALHIMKMNTNEFRDEGKLVHLAANKSHAKNVWQCAMCRIRIREYILRLGVTVSYSVTCKRAYTKWNTSEFMYVITWLVI